MYQPRSALAVQIYRGLALPFRWLQRPFARTNFGTGWVVLAQRAS